MSHVCHYGNCYACFNTSRQRNKHHYFQHMRGEPYPFGQLQVATSTNRPYACHDCGRTFGTRKAWKSHLYWGCQP